MRDERVADDNSPNSGEPTPPLSAISPGDRLKDRYDVIAHIGSGGMADVFHAWDELFCRDVAIKVLKLSRVTDAMKKRVLREARATCAVDHPHMLRVTDMGSVDDAPFLVTDLLRGASLGEILQQQPDKRIEWRRALRWLLPAMEALHIAHDAGVIHRDIKPDNLFLHRRRDTEVLMVLDLGLVKFTDLEGKSTRWTQSGMFLGTAAYMSPEQANGTVDRRSDVYSMGVTLYRLLSGQHLFPHSIHANMIEIVAYHIWEPPPRLADPSLPPALVEAVYKAVAKRPEGRHQTMAAFAAILSDCLDAAPPVAARTIATGAAFVGLGAALALTLVQVTRDDIVDEPGPATACAPSLAASPEESIDLEAMCTLPDPDEPNARPAEASAVPPHSDRPRSAPAAVTFQRATAELRRCVRDHGDPETSSLTVRATVRADGSVAATRIVGDTGASLLAVCVHDRIAALHFAAGRPRTLEHTYLFATKERPR